MLLSNNNPTADKCVYFDKNVLIINNKTMKLILIIGLLFSVLNLSSSAQSWNVEWQGTSEKPVQDYFADIAPTSGGGFVVLGSEGAPPSGNLYLICYDDKGNMLWNKTFDTPNNDVPQRIRCMANGNLLILGQTTTETSAKTFILKTDASGTEKWRTEPDTTKHCLGNDIISLPDNGFLLCGSTQNSEGNQQLWLARYSENGEMLWARSYAENLQGSIISGKLLPTKGFVLSARVQGNSKNDCDIMVLRTDSLGHEIWTNHIKSPNTQEWPECICCSPDSCFVLAGWAGNCLNDINSEYPVFDHNMLIKKIDQDGKLLWSRSIDSEGSEGGNAVSVRSDGNLIVAGAKLTSFSGKIGPWLLLVNSEGETLDEHMLNMPFDQASEIINTPDSGFVVIGPGYHDKLNRRSNGWIIKFSPL